MQEIYTDLENKDTMVEALTLFKENSLKQLEKTREQTEVLSPHEKEVLDKAIGYYKMYNAYKILESKKGK